MLSGSANAQTPQSQLGQPQKRPRAQPRTAQNAVPVIVTPPSTAQIARSGACTPCGAVPRRRLTRENHRGTRCRLVGCRLVDPEGAGVPHPRVDTPHDPPGRLILGKSKVSTLLEAQPRRVSRNSAVEVPVCDRLHGAAMRWDVVVDDERGAEPRPGSTRCGPRREQPGAERAAVTVTQPPQVGRDAVVGDERSVPRYCWPTVCCNAMTFVDAYSHVTPALEEDAAEKVAALLFRPVG